MASMARRYWCDDVRRRWLHRRLRRRSRARRLQHPRDGRRAGLLPHRFPGWQFGPLRHAVRCAGCRRDELPTPPLPTYEALRTTSYLVIRRRRSLPSSNWPRCRERSAAAFRGRLFDALGMARETFGQRMAEVEAHAGCRPRWIATVCPTDRLGRALRQRSRWRRATIAPQDRVGRGGRDGSRRRAQLTALALAASRRQAAMDRLAAALLVQAAFLSMLWMDHGWRGRRTSEGPSADRACGCCSPSKSRETPPAARPQLERRRLDVPRLQAPSSLRRPW